MSWEEIDEISNDQDDELNQIPPREKQILSTLFNSDNGREALKILYSWTVARPNFPAPDACADGIISSQLMCIREGENNLYRRIRACVADPIVDTPIATKKPKQGK